MSQFSAEQEVRVRHHPHFKSEMDKYWGHIDDAYQGMAGKVVAAIPYPSLYTVLIEVQFNDHEVYSFPEHLIQPVIYEPFEGELEFDI